MQFLSFDDVLLVPTFSEVVSRKDVDTSLDFLGVKLTVPVISSNMDTVTNSIVAHEMRKLGGISALHRFCSIDQNVKEYLASPPETIVSIGLGEYELDRAVTLEDNGASIFLIDVAHAANLGVVTFYNQLRGLLNKASKVIVGNFATGAELEEFMSRVKIVPDAIKVGVGGGSACTTRVVTGVGLPTLSSIISCSEVCNQYDTLLIADGGIRSSGDLSKALAFGADLVMLGRLVAATEESPAKKISTINSQTPFLKQYRGSASAASYAAQGKTAEWRAPEGESYNIPLTGTLKDLMDNLSAGLRSSMSYLNAPTLQRYKHPDFVMITSSGIMEGFAHGNQK